MKKSFSHYVIRFIIILVLFGIFALLLWLILPSIVQDIKTIIDYFN